MICPLRCRLPLLGLPRRSRLGSLSIEVPPCWWMDNDDAHSPYRSGLFIVGQKKVVLVGPWISNFTISLLLHLLFPQVFVFAWLGLNIGNLTNIFPFPRVPKLHLHQPAATYIHTGHGRLRRNDGHDGLVIQAKKTTEWNPEDHWCQPRRRRSERYPRKGLLLDLYRGTAQDPAHGHYQGPSRGMFS